MSRFQIKPKYSQEEKINGVTVFGTGLNPTAYQRDEIFSEKTNGKLKYRTGLNSNLIDTHRFLSEDEKKRLKKEYEQDYATLMKFYTPEELNEFNHEFWSKRPKMELDAEANNRFYDTSNPEHAIIKWVILAGGYSAIAPNYSACQRMGTEYYMITVDEQEAIEQEQVTTKLGVYSKLDTFVKKASKLHLIYLAWALDEKTKGFTELNSTTQMIEKIEEYIDGKLIKGVAKKKCLEKANELLDLFNTDRAAFIMRGLFAAALHYGVIYTKDGSFMTADRRTKLKSTQEESIELLNDPNMIEELEEIKDSVEKFLKK